MCTDVRQVIVPVGYKVNGNGNGNGSDPAESGRELTGPTIVLLPAGSGFPDWPPHGVYVQGYTREGSRHLAERELKLHHAYKVTERDCGRYIYWQVWRRPSEAGQRTVETGRRNGHGR